MPFETHQHSTSKGDVTEILISNDELKVSLLSLGASIYKLSSKDMDGNYADLVLGHKSIDDYWQNEFYFGTTVGRYANRIAQAAFSLAGEKFLLSANQGPHCLHGGKSSLHSKNWHADVSESDGKTIVKFQTESFDGESGFPGHLKLSVIYTLDSSALSVEYLAQSDADTVINLTNHSYFNLGGHDSGSIFEHEVKIDAEKYLPVDEEGIPLEPTLLRETPFDLRDFLPLVAGLRSTDKQLIQAGGYDHCYVLNNQSESAACTVRHPWSGRVLKIYTTEPGVQLYTANHIDDFEGKGGVVYGRYPAFCLETQHFPDSPNRPEFPSTFLKAGDEFYSKTTYEFSLSDED